ncbi:MAG: polyphosphate kinase 1 [Pseudomonadota bacterium]|jgi:polyphosphate kinase
MSPPELKQPQNFSNRELSFLEFNQRVLAQAQDPNTPLLERVRFLCISCSNLDEFFEIRVAGLKQMQDAGANQAGPDGLGVDAQLAAIHERALELVREQYECLNKALLPALAREGIQLLDAEELSPPQLEWLAGHFHAEVEPVLSPLGLDPARPFPRIQNKSLNFIVQLSGEDAFGRDSELAVLQAPRSLPRVVGLPAMLGGGFVLLSSIVHCFVAMLFPGMDVRGCHAFRLTRNSDLFVDDEEVDDLRRALEGELAHRRYGAAVRLETDASCPTEIVDFLLEHFALSRADHHAVDGPVNLNRLTAMVDMIPRPDLKFPAFAPAMHRRIVAQPDLFTAIRHQDILLHHPYQSFAPILDFVRQAAADPNVLAIKQTLYRTGADSPIVDSLVAAAHAGKDVTVVVELRARFDEEANISLATRLQEAGAHVMYGVVGYKTHAKLCLIVRREPEGLRRYCHLGTGNYHPGTSRTYTDYGLFTCHPGIGSDVHEIFLQLTSITRTPTLQHLLQSPFTLHAGLLSRIDREAELARAGTGGRIIAKMNALVDPEIIEALYRASCAGVRIDLIVRGVCCLRPGIPGVSENIRVRSIIGRFLEHPRVYCFGNNGDPALFCSSADWMERNFFRRVEVAFPILDPGIRDRIVSDLELYLEDDRQAWHLGSDGRYSRASPIGQGSFSAQQTLLERYTAQGAFSP